MPNVNIEDKLYEDIREYCRLNKLTISVFVNDLLRKSFMVEKYDEAPPFFKKKKEPEIVSIPVEPTPVKEWEEQYQQNPPSVTVIDQETMDPVEIEPEPIKVEEVKQEKKEEELSPKERARRRVQYL